MDKRSRQCFQGVVLRLGVSSRLMRRGSLRAVAPLLVALATHAVATPNATEQPVATAATIAPVEAVPPLGRLFLTPVERLAIDQRRQGKVAPVERMFVGPTPPPAPRVVTGIVRRSDGRHTVWVDGEPRPAGEKEVKSQRVGQSLPRDVAPKSR
jgi:hypothetical protein